MKVQLILLVAGILACYTLELDEEKSPEEGSLFEGDMVLTPDQQVAIKKATKGKHSYAAIKSHLWMTDGKADVIKYYIGPKLSSNRGARMGIYMATAYIARKTCIKFEQVTKKPEYEPHLYFTIIDGCQSPVGRRAYGNEISLAKGCNDMGTVMHEIGHSLGFFHEQSRPDRDDYVTILWDNIIPSMKYNFQKYGTDRIDSRGFKYDLESLMHYGRYYFGKRRHLITIKTKDPKMQRVIGQRNHFSTGDLAQLNNMYNCKKKNSPTESESKTSTRKINFIKT